MALLILILGLCVLLRPRVIVLALVFGFLALNVNSCTEKDNRRHIANTWLRAIPGSYAPIQLPSCYSRFVENSDGLTVARLDSIVEWHQSDTVILLYDGLNKLPFIDSVGNQIAGSPVLKIDVAVGFVKGLGYQQSNHRIAAVLANSRSVVLGTPQQVAGPIAYYMQQLDYRSLSIQLAIPYWRTGSGPLYDDYLNFTASNR